MQVSNNLNEMTMEWAICYWQHFVHDRLYAMRGFVWLRVLYTCSKFIFVWQLLPITLVIMFTQFLATLSEYYYEYFVGGDSPLDTFLYYLKYALIAFNVVFFIFVRRRFMMQQHSNITNEGNNMDNNSTNSTNEKAGVLFVIAHPDDESMFFTPTILSVRQQQSPQDIHLLCLSTGNFNGLGEIRRKELTKCCTECFGIPANNVCVLDEFEDGPHAVWEADRIANTVANYIQKHNTIKKIITFDEHGISSHPNHIAVHNGIKRLLGSKRIPGIVVYQLITTSLLRKYIGALDVLYSFIECTTNANTVLITAPFRLFFWFTPTFKAMTAHWSQFVWFRVLFVIFSRYSYINTLKPMQATATATATAASSTFTATTLRAHQD